MPNSEGKLSSLVVVVMAFEPPAPRAAARLLVIIVRESKGILSFFVSRIEAEDAERAERRARWRAARGTRRLMVLFSTADWIV